MTADTISILDGNQFMVSSRAGDVDATPSQNHGLFIADTRYLSRWVLTINGRQPTLLSVDDTAYYRVQHFLALATSAVYIDSHLGVVRQHSIGDGLYEVLTLANYGQEPVELDVRIELAADFADLFEVKGQQRKKGELYREIVPGNRLTLGYRRESYRRETWITSSEPAIVTENALTFNLNLKPHAQWSTTIAVRAVQYPERESQEIGRHTVDHSRQDLADNLQEWLAAAPKLSSSWQPLEHIYRRSLIDLAALRFRTPVLVGSLPAAGLPWFMAVFGRDSLLTSYQALPFVPHLAATTLRTLALLQARADDPYRDADPGKIPHELRFGELTAFEEVPHAPYYGSADATPLFLILLEEYVRWTGDRELARSLETEARAAIAWIDNYGDRDGDGYIEYERRSPAGLENQCWKDSGDSIVFSDGTLAATPRATCELQGYVYDAKLRMARLAREVWNDPKWAARLEVEAATLKRRFNEDFWLKDRRFFALGLDRDKRQIDSLTSNIGHLLWSGIADADKAAACAQHLVGPSLFSGWGVRTMATCEAAYNPIGYHVGTVWPHDNAFIAWGLRRYGFRAEAAKITLAMLEAAELFDYRLPEAFAGSEREVTKFPVEYPTACTPQAWAAGTPLLLLRVMLGLESDGTHLLVEPAVPAGIGQLSLLDIPGVWGRRDAFGRATGAINGARTSSDMSAH